MADIFQSAQRAESQQKPTINQSNKQTTTSKTSSYLLWEFLSPTHDFQSGPTASDFSLTVNLVQNRDLCV